MKKSKSIILIITPVLSTLLFNACGGSSSSESTTRDVYQSVEDCTKDWGEAELCEQMNDTDSDDYRRNGGVIVGRPFYGPQYYPSDRAVTYKGRTLSPTTRSTSLKPYTVSSRSSTTSKSSVSSPRSSSTSYGGFGGRTGGGSYSS
jgi:hypothetical protein